MGDKIMKTYNKIFMALICSGLAFATTSCSNDMFDLYPTDTMQIETYGYNDTEVQNVFLDSYYYLRTLSSNIFQINSVGTDEAYDFKKNNSQGQIELNESSWDATFGISSSVWSDCYYMINRCNYALDHLENLSADGKTQIEGEAKFMRAYAYFNLVRLFGPVPLTTTVIGTYTDLYNYDRESVENIYKVIDSDIETAIKNLPESYSNASMVGRATKIAALALKAEAQMTRQNFSGAKTTLESIISYSNSNPSKLGLEDHVKKVYDSTNPNGKEVIFAAQFNNGATQITNGFMGACYLAPTTAEKQPAYYYPDGKKSTIPATIGNSTFLMTWELWNALREDGGERFEAVANNSVYGDGAESIPSEYVWTTNVGGRHCTNFPNCMKYFDFQNEGLDKALSSCDNIIYRYAGILLMYAECLNEGGSSDEAVRYINMIRKRAGVADCTAKSQADVRLAIENENFLELNFEGHRWFDLVRTGRITPVMEAHFAHRTPGLAPDAQGSDNGMSVASADATSGTPAKWKWTGKSDPVLFPIPYNQIQLCDRWEQNSIYK